jgi:hypothetical protein
VLQLIQLTDINNPPTVSFAFKPKEKIQLRNVLALSTVSGKNTSIEFTLEEHNLNGLCGQQ